MNRFLLLVLTLVNFDQIHKALGQDDKAPDIRFIEETGLALLRSHAPIPDPKGAVLEPGKGGTIQYGRLFDTSIMALVSFCSRPVNDAEFDYPPCYLSLFEWQSGQWKIRQYLGSASKFDIHERRDLGLKILQGWCQTERHGGEESSWKWGPESRRLVPTGLDDWGPYSIIGDFICYRRGKERLAHSNTRWIYPFINGKRGDLIACFHEDDAERWTISFRGKTNPKQLTHWAFNPDLGKPNVVSVRMAEREDYEFGEEIAVLHLPEGEELSQEFCFELLTGLSIKLSEDAWLEKIPKTVIRKRPAIEVTGDAEVAARFQWPRKTPPPATVHGAR